ncbi:MAG: acyl-CoA dehydrogenase family protein [Thaumarchaeota archaeon]|nr:acyl-CoA dehydrogenase family protein [Nitrososphaerota archaeon]
MLKQDDFSSLSKFNFDLSDEQSLILENVDRACKVVRPVEDRRYLEHKYNEQVRKIFADAHLLGLPISRKYGDGQGADMLTYALTLERIGREGTGVRTFFSGHVSLGQLTVQRWGNEDQKSRYLVPASKGESVFAFALTEPGAGSDPASLQTSFEEKGGNFTLNGQKMWISNGSVADALVIFAYPSGKRDGMCAFIVDRGSEGFSAKAIENKMGLYSSDTGTIYLDNCIVPKENLLGPRGRGLSIAYSALMSGRLSVAAGCVGVIHDCLDEAVRYAGIRFQHGKLIGKHQLVQRHIGIMATNLEASRWLTLRAAYLRQKYEEQPTNPKLREVADSEIAKAKYFASNAAFEAANSAVQVMGANGFSLENRPGRHLIDTRVCRIYEGTDEILEQKIALSVLGKDFEAFS